MIRNLNKKDKTMKNQQETPTFTDVITARMGSCHCGDCYCKVYADGTIQYEGEMEWQRSNRRPFMGDEEPYRPYNSRLTVEDYQHAIQQSNN